MSDVENETQRTERKRGEMIAVCSAKGGIGRTVFAVNLAVALCKKSIQIALLDGDFQFGDISMALDLHTTFSIKDVVDDFEQLDVHTLSSYLNYHDSGVKVLAAPDRPEYADLMTADVVNKVIDLLLMEHEYVVVDTPVGLQESSLALLEKADQILIMTNLEMATLKNTKLMLETLNILGLRHKAQIVINRSTMDSVIKATDIPEILGEENPVYIPNDFQIVSQSLNIGIPFVLNQGKTEVAKAMFKAAELLTSRREISLFQPKKSSLVSKLFHRPQAAKGGAK